MVQMPVKVGNALARALARGPTIVGHGGAHLFLPGTTIGRCALQINWTKLQKCTMIFVLVKDDYGQQFRGGKAGGDLGA